LLDIDGIGETQINSIKNFFSNHTNLKVLNALLNELTIEKSFEVGKNGPLKNKTFMLTGKLENISRAEAKSLIEKNSGSIVSNVTKKLDYLIIGNNPTKRKVGNAKEMNIKVINQVDLMRMLNKGS
jgi:DNA ligase (NAD+)